MSRLALVWREWQDTSEDDDAKNGIIVEISEGRSRVVGCGDRLVSVGAHIPARVPVLDGGPK